MAKKLEELIESSVIKKMYLQTENKKIEPSSSQTKLQEQQIVHGEEEKYGLKVCHKILTEIAEADGKLNHYLQDLLKKYPVEFQIVDEVEQKAEFVTDNKQKFIVYVSNESLNNHDVLQEEIAIETGKYLTSVSGCHAENWLQVDILGAELAHNAGYDFRELPKRYMQQGKKEHAHHLSTLYDVYQKADLMQRLEELPNTPAGEKVKSFIREVSCFFDDWDEQKKTADRFYEKMSDTMREDLACENIIKRNKCSKLKAMDIIYANSYFKYTSSYERYGIILTIEEAQKEVIESFAKRNLYDKLAQLRINPRVDYDFKVKDYKGYCCASLMQCLKKSDREGELDSIFNTKPQNMDKPEDLFKHLMSMEKGKYAEFMHRCGDNGCYTVQHIINKYHIRAGALVCLQMDGEIGDTSTLEKTDYHLMLYTGKNKQGKLCFCGFDWEEKDAQLKNYNIGYVCDSYELFAQMIKDYHRVDVRGGYIDTDEQGNVQTENKDIKYNDLFLKNKLYQEQR